ncbi:hypothetical protein ABZT28_11250 [Streptomyces sp. NPDC005388]|uniref:hypothetical protein n=1 Tax=Streptomyces sp. NPDC005388 TaxID=3156717 RepID=UPI0033BA179C
MTNVTAREPEADRASTMTLRVYSVSREGLITEDRGTVAVLPCQDLPIGMNGFPPCQCPLHASRKLVTR